MTWVPMLPVTELAKRADSTMRGVDGAAAQGNTEHYPSQHAPSSASREVGRSTETPIRGGALVSRGVTKRHLLGTVRQVGLLGVSLLCLICVPFVTNMQAQLMNVEYSVVIKVWKEVYAEDR